MTRSVNTIPVGLMAENAHGARFVVVAYTDESGEPCARIRDDGGLAEAVAGSSVSHGATGSGADPGRQDSPCPHSAFVDPTGARVVVSDLGTDKLYCYGVDASTCSLSLCSTFDSAPGAG